MVDRKSLFGVLLALVSAMVLVGPATAQAATPVLPNAHAHNDYQHARPLLDALDRGFTSVEADIYPAFGHLYVGHYPWDVRPERTLQSLYLEPLRQRVAANGGRVLPGWDGEFQLLVDIKFNENDGYRWLDAAVRDPRYAGLFTRYVNGEVRRGPVTIVLSGRQPRDAVAGQADRFAFLDGRPGDLGSGVPATLVPLVSADWTTLFGWRGQGPMPEGERAALREHVRKAHAEGRRVRFWATPDAPGADREAVWRELRAAGVDHLGSDDLDGLAAFLATPGATSVRPNALVGSR
ncbi:Glycerophosphoryl diester phosphodiesterase family protein [Streptoalloteichus tenebrarius]|uniref:Altered inheritance of mitochondria protein 6 n=1 Tax=Streptoalloteichus tenebrarius (strain ATCC 17920 / DSM 40477 / JCM 4838 / CBS 697.72 / NBRC 16177 / NCIMB 11028 / NRRL B-12390 / A12253. 1 / ISP 5477) TaxID=1933 RepID=A0ABT1HVI2_STRSD|nr:phosphatidylinositol-specific phospholipase C/glycerophosphodiester phosphodiesterase family protein [Streptoalloteichus tenebrarius]MCP2259506.1 Glycerophosphoryl diester phosphodiesterase family protein [Streptoalloteichus tenebrarius]BFF01413.1 phosphatidylinositol-specific phospholipase C/glycerophosphodiester phosphodiesterase family protein [Streptoalloteichus tenebrarius]